MTEVGEPVDGGAGRAACLAAPDSGVGRGRAQPWRAAASAWWMMGVGVPTGGGRAAVLLSCGEVEAGQFNPDVFDVRRHAEITRQFPASCVIDSARRKPWDSPKVGQIE